jgi:cyclopropane fatty-acyl-phospholipid synthase-like methyltransferase
LEASVRSPRRHKTPPSITRLTAATADKHILYEASVQCVEADLAFFERVFRKKRGRSPRLLKEDFCGTSALACQFVKQHPENRAWGVDLHKPTLDWGRARHVARLGEDRDRVTLVQDNVLHVTQPKVEIVCALNFSYFVFKTREALRAYFRTAHSSLAGDGIFVLDCFGGTEAMESSTEDRRIPASISIEGKNLPAFTYIWDQARFNVINHDILCYIHFKFSDGTMMKRAFTYDWRLWTLPELQELLLEAGFSSAEVYMEGWDDKEDEADGIYRRRRTFENMAGWVGYVVGIR